MLEWISEFLGFAVMVGVPALIAVVVLKWADGYNVKGGKK